jgi:hypothetical protein
MWSWSSHQELVAGTQAMLNLEALPEAAGLSAQDFRDSYLDSIGGTERLSSLDELVSDCAGEAGITVAELKAGGRGGAFTIARRLAVTRAQKYGYSDMELARALGCSHAAIDWLRKHASKWATCRR